MEFRYETFNHALSPLSLYPYDAVVKLTFHVKPNLFRFFSLSM